MHNYDDVSLISGGGTWGEGWKGGAKRSEVPILPPLFVSEKYSSRQSKACQNSHTCTHAMRDRNISRLHFVPRSAPLLAQLKTSSVPLHLISTLSTFLTRKII